MERPNNISRNTTQRSVLMTLHNLNQIKPEVKGTTLITYIVPGSINM